MENRCLNLARSMLPLAIAALPGCATQILQSVGNSETGIAYYLPKALIGIQLADAAGDLVLTVDKPVFVADERYRYVLQYVPDAAASDVIEITVDPSSSLLQTANSTAEDKTGDLIVAIAKSASTIAQLAAQAAAEGKVIIFDEQIDPTEDVEDLVWRMNAVASAHAKSMAATLSCANLAANASQETKDQCTAYATWQSGTPIKFAVCRATGAKCPTKRTAPPVARAASSGAGGSVATPALPVAAQGNVPPLAPRDCAPGVCYRAAVPYRIEFSLNDRNQFSTVVSLPNEGPIMLWPFERTAFVKRINNAEFQDGMLKKVHLEKPSEAVEAASLPINVVKAVFDSITGVFKFRVDYTNQEKAFVDAQKQLLESQQALQTAMTPQSAREKRALLSGSTSGRPVGKVLGGIKAAPPPTGPFPGGMVSPGSSGTGAQ